MAQKFRTHARPRAPRWFLIVFVFLAALVLVELYRILIPLKSVNPLWHEVTIGEPVIGHWLYGGRDEEGYLRFYDQNQTIVLPPSAHTFDANGQFVVIEDFSSSSLTFAEPLEAIPVRWVIAGVTVIAAGIWLSTRFFHRHTTFSPKHAYKRQPGFRKRASQPSKNRVSHRHFRPFGQSRNH